MTKSNEKTILIIEDNIDKELGDLENTLRKEGFFVFSITNPDEAIESITSESGINYDLAIVDLSFKGNTKRDGKDIINAMKKRYENKPVLCCSAYSSNKYIRKIFQTSNKKPDGVFAKRRYQPGQVLDIINGFIKRSNPHKQTPQSSL